MPQEPSPELKRVRDAIVANPKGAETIINESSLPGYRKSRERLRVGLIKSNRRSTGGHGRGKVKDASVTEEGVSTEQPEERKELMANLMEVKKRSGEGGLRRILLARVFLAFHESGNVIEYLQHLDEPQPD